MYFNVFKHPMKFHMCISSGMAYSLWWIEIPSIQRELYTIRGGIYHRCNHITKLRCVITWFDEYTTCNILYRMIGFRVPIIHYIGPLNGYPNRVFPSYGGHVYNITSVWSVLFHRVIKVADG